jgi:hypothetical protein
MNVPAALAALVKERAEHRCEYCRMSQSLQGATFHVEHIIPLTCGGTTTEDNLALACPSCNLHKSDRSHAVDPDTQAMATLFHPRRQRWSDEFAWEDRRMVGITATGRATIQALDLNHPRRLRVREAEALFGLFPPSA